MQAAAGNSSPQDSHLELRVNLSAPHGADFSAATPFVTHRTGNTAPVRDTELARNTTINHADASGRFQAYVEDTARTHGKRVRLLSFPATPPKPGGTPETAPLDSLIVETCPRARHLANLVHPAPAVMTALELLATRVELAAGQFAHRGLRIVTRSDGSLTVNSRFPIPIRDSVGQVDPIAADIHEGNLIYLDELVDVALAKLRAPVPQAPSATERGA